MKIAIVASRFNNHITDKLVEGALFRLQEKGVDSVDIEIVYVPGAVELPIMAQHFALMKSFKAIICFGAVIRGETDHYDYVARQASDGCQKVALKYHIPVIFGVLTTHNLEQAQDRVGGKRGHVGKECADAALEMVELLNQYDLRKESAFHDIQEPTLTEHF